MMTNNTKNSAQQKSKNLRKRSRTDVIVAAKVSRIENSKTDVIDPYLHSDTIPMFSSISHHSRCIIKRTLLVSYECTNFFFHFFFPNFSTIVELQLHNFCSNLFVSFKNKINF